ncbi:MAG: IS256 family transposase [Anaerolineae bacterium]
MTYQPNYSLPVELVELAAAQGLDALPEVLRIVINAAMTAERQKFLGAEPYQRSEERRGHANGFKPKTVKTRVGEVTFAVPQVREGGFYPTALEKGLRSERALKLALAEMYIQGVSTRKVTAVLEKLCGTEVSSMEVSRAVAALDKVVEAWRNRPLGEFVYVTLDARYEKVRQDGAVRDAALLIATGVGADGKRRVLGVSVSLGEHEVHWRTFLQSLVARGLRGVQLIVSDAHEGLGAARRTVFGGVPWQRCQFHLQQNARAYVPREELKAEVATDIRAIFNAPHRAEAEALLAKTVLKYAKTASKLSTWMEANLPQGFTVFDLPEAHRRLLRTTNGLERVNEEIRRRTRVVGIFPNEAACLRLASAILMEISDEWEAGKAYLTFKSA